MGILVLQVGASHLLLPSLHKADVYPLYDWNLFSYTPPVRDFFTVKVLELDGQKLETPVWVINDREQFPGRQRHLVPHQSFRLGKALREASQNPADLSRFQQELEQNLFFRHHQAVYEITHAELDLVGFLRDPNPEVFQSLRRFDWQKSESP